jgi:hypothetical protein
VPTEDRYVPRRAAGVFSGYRCDSSFSDLVKSGESTLLSNTCNGRCPPPGPVSSAELQCDDKRDRQALYGLQSQGAACSASRLFDEAWGVTSRSAAAPGNAAPTPRPDFARCTKRLGAGALSGGKALKGSSWVIHEPSSPCAPSPVLAACSYS